MATLNRDEIIGALERLGQLACDDGVSIELIALGGAVMVLAYNAVCQLAMWMWLL
jgi:hypothetical protein